MCGAGGRAMQFLVNARRARARPRDPGSLPLGLTPRPGAKVEIGEMWMKWGETLEGLGPPRSRLSECFAHHHAVNEANPPTTGCPLGQLARCALDQTPRLHAGTANRLEHPHDIECDCWPVG